MNCVIHPTLPAVATCQVCGAGLCPDCFQAFKPPVCQVCVHRHKLGLKKSFIISFVVSLVFFAAAAAYIIYSIQADPVGLKTLNQPIVIFVMAFWAGCFPQGWLSLGQIPRGFLIFGSGVYSPAGGYVDMSGIILLAIRALFAFVLGPLFLLINIIRYALLMRSLR